MAAVYLIQESSLTTIADAIRAKTGKTEKMTPEQMEVEIASISDAEEAVAAIIEGRSVEIVNGIVVKIADEQFMEWQNLKIVDFPSVTEIGDKAFFSCPKLESANFPSAVTVGEYAFQNCPELVSVNLPEEIGRAHV